MVFLVEAFVSHILWQNSQRSCWPREASGNSCRRYCWVSRPEKGSWNGDAAGCTTKRNESKPWFNHRVRLLILGFVYALIIHLLLYLKCHPSADIEGKWRCIMKESRISLASLGNAIAWRSNMMNWGRKGKWNFLLFLSTAFICIC